MVVKLYAVSDSPPSLAVKMALEYLNVPFEYVEVDFVAGEHLSDSYGEINPQQEVPVLDDNGFQLSESIAILQYLADRYGQDNIYSKDEQDRAVVNHRLAFCLSTYYRYISDYVMGPIFYGYERSPIGLKKVHIALNVLERYLKKHKSKYAAGNELTIADFALVSATICLDAINFDISNYEKVNSWYNTFKIEHPRIWKVAESGMLEIKEFNKNPPNLNHLNHPFHPKKSE